MTKNNEVVISACMLAASLRCTLHFSSFCGWPSQVAQEWRSVRNAGRSGRAAFVCQGNE